MRTLPEQTVLAALELARAGRFAAEDKPAQHVDASVIHDIATWLDATGELSGRGSCR